jgi:hypothetical protein
MTVGVLWRVLICVQLVSTVSLVAQTADIKTASIKGVIQTEDGTAVAGARVQVIRTTAPPFNLTLAIAKDGSFTAEGLPAGTYRICPDLPGPLYLSPCIWFDQNAIVTVKDGQQVDGVSITLRQGSTITVVVRDPAAIMQTKRSKEDPPQFLFIAVKGPKKIPYPLVGGKQDGAVTTYQMVVPNDTPLKLIAFPLGVSAVEASAGEVPDKGKSIEFSRPRHPSKLDSEQGAPTFQFTINKKHN